MILGGTALSFLGIGLRPPVVSLGVLLRQAQNLCERLLTLAVLTPLHSRRTLMLEGLRYALRTVLI